MSIIFTLKNFGNKYRVECEVKSETHSPGFVTKAYSTKEEALEHAEKMLEANWENWKSLAVQCNNNDYELYDKTTCCVCKHSPGEHTCVTCLEPVCWTCNYSKSCFAVCETCHDNEESCKKCGMSKDYDCVCD